MDVLQRLQALDILFAILWAGIVGWGLQTGIVRQLGMLVGVYAAALVAGTLYRPGGAALALAFGRENLPQLEFAAYVALFILVFAVIGVIIWRAYPASRMSRGFGADNVLGAALGAVWGCGTCRCSSCRRRASPSCRSARGSPRWLPPRCW